ncbi:hypothetical protein GCM10010282_68780 [Streptomyces roseolus]|nr:hypothetical protein GCM10010282_68780 [Streptomyces roseolus]
MAESVEMRATVREPYGPADLSSVPVFAGGFIDFGYRRSADLADTISVDDRVRSRQDLYRRVLDSVGPLADGTESRSAAGSASGARRRCASTIPAASGAWASTRSSWTAPTGPTRPCWAASDD